MPYTEMLVTWAPLPGGTGYSKFRFIGGITGSALNTAAANLRTFLDAIKAIVPTGVTLTFQAGVSVHADDGTLTFEDTITTVPSPVTGTVTATYASASGLMVMWNTGAINGGHKVRGRTYFVPCATGVFQSDGTIVDATRTTVLNAANTFATSTPAPCVNSRARASNPAAGNQTVAMISATVPDKQCVLRSRRD